MSSVKIMPKVVTRAVKVNSHKKIRTKEKATVALETIMLIIHAIKLSEIPTSKAVTNNLFSKGNTL